jgi:hypothetical protein
MRQEPTLPAPFVVVDGVPTAFPKHVLSDYATQWEHWWQGS